MSPTAAPGMPGSSPASARPELTDQDRQNLQRLLSHARDLGFLGPGDVGDQITRSVAFAVAAGISPPAGLVTDLGSGGGLPALVLALVWPDSRWLLIDSNQLAAKGEFGTWCHGPGRGRVRASRVGCPKPPSSPSPARHSKELRCTCSNSRMRRTAARFRRLPVGRRPTRRP